MRNLITRSIMWIVAVPTLIAIIVLLPHWNHLLFNLIVVAAAGLGARELAGLFEKHDASYRASSLTIPLLGASLPVVELLILNGLLPRESVPIAIYAIAALILVLQLFRRQEEDFQHALSNSAANVALTIYPGLFLSYLIRLSAFEHASAVILAFLCAVILNDTIAYLFGMLYRRVRDAIAGRRGKSWKQRVVVPVSPNKTLVGFAGGLAASPATLLAANALFPRLIPGEPLVLVTVGLAVGVATILGDLIESALKRSATSKDSGSLIPGRGGVLDSIDSVLYAAPVFYYLFRYAL